MEKLSLDELIAQFKGMTLLELQEFTKRFEETFGVRASFVVQEPASVPIQEVRDKAPTEEEQFEFDVILVSVGPEKIKVIKEIRAVYGLGLKDAKDKVDATPTIIGERMPREDAEALRHRLEAVGATLEVK